MKKLLLIISLFLSALVYSYTCFMCGGSGVVNCNYCNGGGCSMQCMVCNGTGTEMESCTACSGYGVQYGVRCYSCKGIGFIQRRCSSCYGTGCAQKCFNCGGKGAKICNDCRGTGEKH